MIVGTPRTIRGGNRIDGCLCSGRRTLFSDPCFSPDKQEPRSSGADAPT